MKDFRAITEQRRMTSDADALLSAIPSAAILCRPNGRILNSNRMAQRLLGATSRAVRGVDIANFWCDPVQRRNLAAILRRNRHLSDVATDMSGPGGRRFRVFLSGTPVRLGDEPAFLVFFRDVEGNGANAVSDSEVRHLLNAMPLPLTLVHTDTKKIALMNDSARILFGYDSEDEQEEVVGYDLWVHPEKRDAMMDRLRRDGRVDEVEMEARSRTGRRFWMMQSAVIVPFRGQMVAMVAGTDINMRKKAEDELRRLANTDSLTGIYNRRAFYDKAALERARSDRYGWPLTILLADLDHFKKVNDTHGHVVGDVALQHFIACTQRELRPSDVFARMGGEEFCIMLTGTDMAGAMAVAERIRATTERQPLTGAGHAPVRLTVSMGVAVWRKGEILDSVLKRVDDALYASKFAGRNRVIRAPEK